VTLPAAEVAAGPALDSVAVLPRVMVGQLVYGPQS
jgi:hypothetical protein